MSNYSIPVCLPRLPLAEKILPYLQKIDSNRWYSNFGPLHSEFTSRLSALFNVKSSQLVCGTTGTQLLEICLRALGIKAGSSCVMPAWTFIATPLAAVSANLEPVFIDVDAKTQALCPEMLLALLPQIREMGAIGAVIVTAPFGKPIDTLAWDKFTDTTGIPVIIDAAAAFDSMLCIPEMEVRNTPMMVSLHATKAFGIGEGGVIFSQNEKLIQNMLSLTQFGFRKGERESRMLGTNIKVSEYVCAVGLAALDDWPITRAAWEEVTQNYLKALNQVGITNVLSSDWISSTCNILIPEKADTLAQEYEQQNIMVRKWWGEGCHHQPVFRQARCVGDLKNTEFLRKSILGLPFYLDLTATGVNNVINCLSIITA
jgi:dTDP-4-amino-4,6-dideoxygalactose transaminase